MRAVLNRRLERLEQNIRAQETAESDPILAEALSVLSDPDFAIIERLTPVEKRTPEERVAWARLDAEIEAASARASQRRLIDNGLCP